MGRSIAYCRVSARDQNPQLPLDALHAHGMTSCSPSSSPECGTPAGTTMV
jgi:hypothetical protein